MTTFSRLIAALLGLAVAACAWLPWTRASDAWHLHLRSLLSPGYSSRGRLDDLDRPRRRPSPAAVILLGSLVNSRTLVIIGGLLSVAFPTIWILSNAISSGERRHPDDADPVRGLRCRRPRLRDPDPRGRREGHQGPHRPLTHARRPLRRPDPGAPRPAWPAARRLHRLRSRRRSSTSTSRDEMRGSFLEYAYSVIYSRALPDARDGLKPVQRRILFQMAEMGLRPDRGHVKSARVVGDVMGKLHPHGDGAIYDALVRMAQPFSLRLPLVDGHGNFGSLDDGPAAMRYTECRLAPDRAAHDRPRSTRTSSTSTRTTTAASSEPVVLPAAFPNLLVNGAAGIAVGMATNMAPHNLVEVIAAARHLLTHPKATLDDLMGFVPGPDLPDRRQDRRPRRHPRGLRDRTRRVPHPRDRARRERHRRAARASSSPSCPTTSGRRRSSRRSRRPSTRRSSQGISDVNDLTDMEPGLSAWSSRSRTASTPRRSSSSSTRSRRWRTRSASTTSRSSTASRAPSGCASCSRSSSTTGSRSYAAARRTAAAGPRSGCTSSTACSSRSSTSTRSSRSSGPATTPPRRRRGS